MKRSWVKLQIRRAAMFLRIQRDLRQALRSRLRSMLILPITDGTTRLKSVLPLRLLIMLNQARMLRVSHLQISIPKTTAILILSIRKMHLPHTGQCPALWLHPQQMSMVQQTENWHLMQTLQTLLEMNLKALLPKTYTLIPKSLRSHRSVLVLSSLWAASTSIPTSQTAARLSHLPHRIIPTATAVQALSSILSTRFTM